MGTKCAKAAAVLFTAPGMTTDRDGGHPLDRGLRHIFGRDPHDLGQGFTRLGVGHASHFGEARLDGPRAQRGDTDAGAPQFGAEGPPIGKDEGFRRAVGGLGGQRLEGGGRGGVEDRASVPGDHAGHKERAQVDDRFHVRPHHGELGAALCPKHRTHGGEAGVVDEEVHRQAALFDQSWQLASGVGIGQISRNDLGADVMRAGQLAGESLEAIFSPGHQGDSVAPPGELSSDLGADA